MTHFRVAVIGAGISGICAAIYLKRAGIDPVIVLEKADDIGGTWRDNHYPGAACDVPSHLYSYSFEQKPDWSCEFPPAEEIQEYIRSVMVKYGVADRIRTGAHVLSGEFSDGSWTLNIEGGDTVTADIVVSALGGLHTPNIPTFPGVDSFGGPIFHTAQWPKDIDLSGKRVALIGTGATAVQVGPEVAKIADHLTVFQRTPVWVGPKRNTVFTDDEIERFRHDPVALQKKRWELWRDWEVNGLDLVTPGSEVNRKGGESALASIARSITDPSLRAALTPDYNYTCKRPTISSNYYPMFERENVSLEQSPIVEVQSGAIVTEDNRHEIDAIILATGFKAWDITTEIDLKIKGGPSLKKMWTPRISSYKTVLAPGIPNLFLILGPNSAGVTSLYQMAESACEYLVSLIDYMDKHCLREVVPKPEEVRAFGDLILRKFAKTTQNKGCTSWWTDETGYPYAMWPDGSIAYRSMMLQFEPRHLQFK